MYPIYIIIWDSGTYYFDFMHNLKISFLQIQNLILSGFQVLSNFPYLNNFILMIYTFQKNQNLNNRKTFYVFYG